jgi:hypothetical protein
MRICGLITSPGVTDDRRVRRLRACCPSSGVLDNGLFESVRQRSSLCECDRFSVCPGVYIFGVVELRKFCCTDTLDTEFIDRAGDLSRELLGYPEVNDDDRECIF